MKKFSIFLAVILSVPILTVAQLGAKAQQNKIQGIWQNNSFGYQMTLMLNADGSGEFDGDAIKYTTQGSNLIHHRGSAKSNQCLHVHAARKFVNGFRR
jgi:hypothetical protein